jgi:hypothetical protein
MSRKLIALVSTSLLAITLSGCGYDGHFRYACQDPENWGAVECTPPVCEATGTCTKDLLGYDPLATESDTIEIEEVVEEATESEIVEVEE